MDGPGLPGRVSPFGDPRVACLRLTVAFRSFATSFIASWCQGIHIELYEQPRVQQSLVANTDVAMPQSPLGLRLREALAGGAELLLSLLVGIVHLWSVWLLLAAGYLIWKRTRKPAKSV